MTGGCSYSDVSNLFYEPLKCESPTVKDTVIQIYKKHDDAYQIAIDNIAKYGWSNILRVDLVYPQAISYDESINKYFCEGNFVHITNDGKNAIESHREYTVQKTDEGTLVRLKHPYLDWYPDQNIAIIK